MLFIAHTGEPEMPEADPSLLSALAHQPIWVSLLIIAFFLFGVYVLLEKLKVKPLNRLIALMPLLILIAIVYLEHNPAVTTVVLSVGFVVTFFLAFTMMTSGREAKPKDKKEIDQKDEAKQ